MIIDFLLASDQFIRALFYGRNIIILFIMEQKCIVNVADGLPNTNWKSMDEASTLRSNPDSYRLSCVTFAHGDVTVETYPPVNADQWTR
jgi:hypothetical protein